MTTVDIVAVSNDLLLLRSFPSPAPPPQAGEERARGQVPSPSQGEGQGEGGTRGDINEGYDSKRGSTN